MIETHIWDWMVLTILDSSAVRLFCHLCRVIACGVCTYFVPALPFSWKWRERKGEGLVKESRLTFHGSDRFPRAVASTYCS